MNQVGMQLLEMCAADSSCSLTFGGKNVTDFMSTLFDKLFNKQTCKIVNAKKVTAAKLRFILATLLTNRITREVIPALLYRLNRCDDDMDIGVISFFFDTFEKNRAQLPSCVPLFSPMLQKHMIASELWQPTSTKQLQKLFDSTFFASDWVIQQQDIFEMWTNNELLYPQDAYFNKTFSTTTASVLLLNGKLDAQTPIKFAQESFALIEAPNKWLVEMPFANHYVIGNSPTNASATTCGMSILISFINNPLQQPDMSCAQTVIPVNFNGNPNSNKIYLGVEDIWNGLYYPTSEELKVSLWLFVGVESGTLLGAVSLLALALFWVAELKVRGLKKTEYSQI